MDYLALIRQQFPDPQSAALVRLQGFLNRFLTESYGEGHILFACHAAFPLYLTPDLLYRLWMNFSRYEIESAEGDPPAYGAIHRVAVSDLLQSALIRPVGGEVFEMLPEIRNVLLLCLDRRFRDNPRLHRPVDRLKELARFLLQYQATQAPSRNPFMTAVQEAQQWNALAFLQPARAAGQLRQALSQAIRNQSKGQYHRLRLLVEDIRGKYRQLGQWKAENELEPFRTLSVYTEGMAQFFAGEETLAFETLAGLTPAGSAPDTAGSDTATVKITIPQRVREALTRRDVAQQQAPGKILALLIGIDDYATSQLEATGSVDDALAFQEALLATRFGWPVEVKLLADRDATKAGILDHLRRQLQDARPQDALLLYFSGHSTRSNRWMEEESSFPYSALVCSDYDDQYGSNTGLLPLPAPGLITDRELQAWIDDHNPRNIPIILVLDTSHSGSHRWVNPRRDILLAACAAHEQSYIIRQDATQRGVFTQAIVRALTDSQGALSYQHLMRRMEVLVGDQYRQTPQLFGSEEHVDRLVFRTTPTVTARMQELLRLLGYYHGAIDGEQGPQMTAALQQFGQLFGLAADQVTQDHLEYRLIVRDAGALRVGYDNSRAPLQALVDKLREQPADRQRQQPLTTKSSWKNQLAGGNLEDVLRSMQTAVNPRSPFSKEIDSLTSQWSRLQRKNLQTKVSFQTEERERNRIRQSTLSLLEELPDTDLEVETGNIKAAELPTVQFFGFKFNTGHGDQTTR